MKVTNTATVGPQPIDIIGTATPVDTAYGAGGAFVVSFPGTPGTECPGPNYIVQGEFCASRYGTRVDSQDMTRLCCGLGNCANTKLEHFVYFEQGTTTGSRQH